MVKCMNKDEYIQAIRRVGKGYLFILLNINIGSLNILPNWIGYIFFHKAIPSIAKYERSATLLNPFIIFLGLYELICWGLQIVGISLDIYIFGIIISALKLYFDFQMLTNIADIAVSHQYKDSHKIYTPRNIQTILLTITFFINNWNESILGSFVYVFIVLIVAFWICLLLFDYAKYEEKYLHIDLIGE